MAAEAARSSETAERNGLPSLLLAVVGAAASFPFDPVLAGMVAAGQGVEAICLYLSLSRALLDEHLVRLGLRTPPDRPLRGGGGARAWSAIDTMRLIAWRMAGVHPKDIGARLGRSANAVRARSRRLGVPTPARRTLHRLDPSKLRDPDPVTWPTRRATSTPGPVSASGVSPWQAEDCSQAEQPSPQSPPSPTVIVVPPAAATSQHHSRPAQREMPLLRVMPAPREVGILDGAVSAATPAAPSAPVVRPADDDLSWVGNGKRITRSCEAVLALSLRHFGGENWRVTARRAGITEGTLRTLRTRIDLPLDPDRKKFSQSYDADLARRNLAACGFDLKVEADSGRWFWRKRGSCDRLSLTTQLNRGLINKDDFKRFRPRKDLLTSRRSQPEMRELLHEEPDRSRYPAAFRPGLPGHPGQQVSCA